MSPSVDDVLSKIVQAATVDELWRTWLLSMEAYGFQRVMYGLTRFPTGLMSGDPKDFFILTNFCKNYVSGFIESKLFIDAPMLRWALENVGAKSWNHLQDLKNQGLLTPSDLRVIQFNHSFRIIAGYTISFPLNSDYGRAAVSLSGGKNVTQDAVDANWELHGEKIMLINQVAHLKVLTLPHATFSGQNLTKRQCEVLQWVSDGKTTQDIAILMDVSKATVEKHLRLAREVMGVETTAQAVLRMAYQNQIFRIS